MSEIVWVVDEFIDTLRERKRKLVEREKARGWFHRHAFDTREEAVSYLISRAQERLVLAEKEVASAERRVKSAERKLHRCHLLVRL